MIVQSAPDGEPHFVIAMHQHTAFAGALAKHFGNESFVGLEPAEPMQYIVEHHDQGWAELDKAAPQNHEDGLPYNLTATPMADIVATSAGSPVFNEAFHPFSGIISSMHTYGLYTGRYGLSDKIFLDAISADMRPQVDAMLENELARQGRLKAALGGTDHANDDYLFHAYKQLQFFDTLSLYLHMAHAGSRGQSAFLNVPQAVGTDVTVTVEERPGEVYALDPYPFAADNLHLATKGRWLTPQPQGTDLGALLAGTPVTDQRVLLVAG